MNLNYFVIERPILEAHRAWSDEKFGKENGPVGPLKHLSEEALEAAENPTDIIEYADCMFLMLDALHRGGFTMEDLNRAMEHKLTILKSRTYHKPKDGEPSRHVKEE